MRKILAVLILLFPFSVFAAQWQANVSWPAPPLADANAATNVHCDVNVPAATNRGQAASGVLTLSFTFTANQGDILNCATQLVRNGLYGIMGSEVPTTVPFLAPGPGPVPIVIITQVPAP